MVEGIYKLLHSKYAKPMNLGNPEEIALIEVANEIITLGNNSNKIIFKPLPLNDPLKRKPDITKAMNILNWKPIVSRKKGLKKTFNYFRSLSLDELNKNKKRNSFKICVDGGVDDKTIKLLNVESVVSGSFVLNAKDPVQNIMYLQTSGEYAEY